MPARRSSLLPSACLLSLLGFFACSGNGSSSSTDPYPPTGPPVMMSIYNMSDYDLVDLEVSAEFYGTLGVGERADPRLFPFAYRYAYVTAIVDGERLTIQPVDFVGETPLGLGSYMYVLDVEGAVAGQRRLTMEVIVD